MLQASVVRQSQQPEVNRMKATLARAYKRLLELWAGSVVRQHWCTCDQPVMLCGLPRYAPGLLRCE